MRQHLTKYKVILLILLILNLLFTGTVLVMEVNERLQESELQDKYTLFIGTNDKDTNLLEISLQECKTRVENVCLQYVEGLTVTEASGVWTDDSGNVIVENTLVCEIMGATKNDINSIVDQLLIDLNQSSIMVEHDKTYFTFRGN